MTLFLNKVYYVLKYLLYRMHKLIEIMEMYTIICINYNLYCI